MEDTSINQAEIALSFGLKDDYLYASQIISFWKRFSIFQVEQQPATTIPPCRLKSVRKIPTMHQCGLTFIAKEQKCFRLCKDILMWYLVGPLFPHGDWRRPLKVICTTTYAGMAYSIYYIACSVFYILHTFTTYQGHIHALHSQSHTIQVVYI